VGNPNLQPEESKTYEAAVGHKGDGYSLDLVYHYSKLDNLIDSVPDTVDPFLRVRQNIDKAVISGTELALTVTPTEGLSVKGSLEYLDTEDETTGERLTDSARITGKVHLAYVRNAMSYFLNAKTYRDYYAAPSLPRNAPNENSNYTVFDAKVSYAYDKHIELFGGVDNILDKQMPDNMQLFGHRTIRASATSISARLLNSSLVDRVYGKLSETPHSANCLRGFIFCCANYMANRLAAI
jgi:outer membrane receptor for ferrienterochelin and colicins